MAVVFARVDLAAPAWVVSLVHVLELLILLVPALLAREEWLSPEQGLAESGPAEALG